MYPRYILEASTRCGLHAKPRRATATEARRRRGHSVYGESDIHRDGAVERLNASSALPKKGEWWLRLSKVRVALIVTITVPLTLTLT